MPRECFKDKIGRGNPWLSKYFNFPKKQLYTILSSVEVNARIFFPENFAERVLILHDCPKRRKVTEPPFPREIISQECWSNGRKKIKHLFQTIVVSRWLVSPIP